MSLSVKVFLRSSAADQQATVRRFPLDVDVSTNYDYLRAKIVSNIPSLRDQPFRLYWKDEENDLIAFSSDEELTQALSQVDDGVLRIYLEQIGDTTPQGHPPCCAASPLPGLLALAGEALPWINDLVTSCAAEATCSNRDECQSGDAKQDDQKGGQVDDEKKESGSAEAAARMEVDEERDAREKRKQKLREFIASGIDLLCTTLAPNTNDLPDRRCDATGSCSAEGSPDCCRDGCSSDASRTSSADQKPATERVNREEEVMSCGDTQTSERGADSASQKVSSDKQTETGHTAEENRNDRGSSTAEQSSQELYARVVDTLMSMGFNNDDGWLSNVVAAYSGQVELILDAIHANC